MKGKGLLIAGLLSSALAVGLGAMGSHALEELLQQNNRVETYSTAVDYHIFHSLGILIITILMQIIQIRFLKISGVLMLAGIIFFSGSLYLLSITSYTFWAYFTPLGGIMFIIAWILPVWGLIRRS